MFACRRGASGVAGSLGLPPLPLCRLSHIPRLRGTRYFPSQPKRLHEAYTPGGFMRTTWPPFWLKVVRILPPFALLPFHFLPPATRKW